MFFPLMFQVGFFNFHLVQVSPMFLETCFTILAIPTKVASPLIFHGTGKAQEIRWVWWRDFLQHHRPLLGLWSCEEMHGARGQLFGHIVNEVMP